MKKIYTLTYFLLCLLAMGGCDTFRNTFGLDHYSPKEWDTAEPSPGLILPPDFASRPKLPPPNPGAPNPHVIPETVRAQKTVLGDTQPVNTSPSSTKGEQDLLEKASEHQEITPNIRQKVDEEAQADSTISAKIISKIQSWKKEASDNLSLSKTDETNIKEGDKPKDKEDDKLKDESDKTEESVKPEESSISDDTIDKQKETY
jgi:type IV secretory pathway VirB10-like protein